MVSEVGEPSSGLSTPGRWVPHRYTEQINNYMEDTVNKFLMAVESSYRHGNREAPINPSVLG